FIIKVNEKHFISFPYWNFHFLKNLFNIFMKITFNFDFFTINTLLYSNTSSIRNYNVTFFQNVIENNSFGLFINKIKHSIKSSNEIVFLLPFHFCVVFCVKNTIQNIVDHILRSGFSKVKVYPLTKHL